MSDINNKIDEILEMIRQGGKDWLWGKDNLKEAKKALTALIQSEIRDGRIDELERAYKGISINYREERLAELDKEISDG